MSQKAIRVENLSKRYRIGLPPKKSKGVKALYQSLASPFEYLASTLRKPSDQEIIWALKDVSFEVDRGEVVGLIGCNGAGKSTLLKVLSRITEPTGGRARIKGRVGSLLEVGTGFHQELTGRENIYLNGSILGMKRAEIDEKFDEIAAFSGIEKFLDTPVKRYSSGMSVRLAFSVAAHLRPEILLVDEVLAVGDAAFQRKCLGKMEDVAAQGRTVLFVSHNMVAIQSLCKRALWLQEGRVISEGAAAEVVMQYLQSETIRAREQSWKTPEQAPGNDLVRLRRVCVRPVDGGPEDPIDPETPFLIEVEFWNLTPDLYLDIRIHLHTEYDIVALGADSTREPEWHGRKFPVGLFRSRCFIPANWLNSGTYRVSLKFVKDGRRKVYVQSGDWLSFDIADAGERSGSWFGKEEGILRPILEWETELLESESESLSESRNRNVSSIF